MRAADAPCPADNAVAVTAYLAQAYWRVYVHPNAARYQLVTVSS